MLGTGLDETKRAFERAQSLLEHVPQHPLRGLCLHALGLALCLRGELEEANALAQRTEALAAATGDRDGAALRLSRTRIGTAPARAAANRARMARERRRGGGGAR